MLQYLGFVFCVFYDLCVSLFKHMASLSVLAFSEFSDVVDMEIILGQSLIEFRIGIIEVACCYCGGVLRHVA